MPNPNNLARDSPVCGLPSSTIPKPRRIDNLLTPFFFNDKFAQVSLLFGVCVLFCIRCWHWSKTWRSVVFLACINQHYCHLRLKYKYVSL